MTQVINLMSERNLWRYLQRNLCKKGLFIIHRHKKDKLPITEKINILDVRTYGISKVYIAN